MFTRIVFLISITLLGFSNSSFAEEDFWDDGVQTTSPGIKALRHVTFGHGVEYGSGAAFAGAVAGVRSRLPKGDANIRLKHTESLQKGVQSGRLMGYQDIDRVHTGIQSNDVVRIQYFSSAETKRKLIEETQAKIDVTKAELDKLNADWRNAKNPQQRLKLFQDLEVKRSGLEHYLGELDKDLAELKITNTDKFTPTKMYKTIRSGVNTPAEVEAFLQETRSQNLRVGNISRLSKKGQRKLKTRKLVRKGSPWVVLFGTGVFMLDDRISGKLRQRAEDQIVEFSAVIPPKTQIETQQLDTVEGGNHRLVLDEEIQTQPLGIIEEGDNRLVLDEDFGGEAAGQ